METTMTKTNNGTLIFGNDEFEKVRVIMIDDEPYFVGKDICVMFGDKNHNRSIGRLDNEDKRTAEIVDSLGRKQSVTIINESGLYALLFAMQPQKTNNGGVSDAYPIEVQERIDKLHKFKRWVTSEVLPSIRKHGTYMTPEQIEKVLLNPDTIIKIATELKEEQEKNRALALENDRQQQIIEEQKPAVEFTKKLAQTEDMIDFNEFAKMLYEKNKFTIGRNRIFQWARNKNILTKNNMPYQQYVQQGYFKVTEVMKFYAGSVQVYPKVLITGKGQLWLAKKLLADYNIK